MRHYYLNEEEIDLVNHLRLLTQTQKTAIICAVHELASIRDDKQIAQYPANVVHLPRRL